MNSSSIKFVNLNFIKSYNLIFSFIIFYFYQLLLQKNLSSGHIDLSKCTFWLCSRLESLNQGDPTFYRLRVDQCWRPLLLQHHKLAYLLFSLGRVLLLEARGQPLVLQEILLSLRPLLDRTDGSLLQKVLSLFHTWNYYQNAESSYFHRFESFETIWSSPDSARGAKTWVHHWDSWCYLALVPPGVAWGALQRVWLLPHLPLCHFLVWASDSGNYFVLVSIQCYHSI